MQPLLILQHRHGCHTSDKMVGVLLSLEQQHIFFLIRGTEAHPTTSDVSLPDLVTVSANGSFVVHAPAFSIEAALDYPHAWHCDAGWSQTVRPSSCGPGLASLWIGCCP